MKILFAGTPKNAADTLVALIGAGYEIVGVLTREDAPVGRKRVMTESPVLEIARDYQLPVIKTNRIDDQIKVRVRELGADLGVVVAYGTIFKADFLELLPMGWVNVHYSLLPRWRGAAPVQHALLCGDTETGVTVFQLDPGMDTGPIWGQLKTPIEPLESAGTLLHRLTQLSFSLLYETIPQIAAGLRAPEGQKGVPTFANKPTRELAQLSFGDSARDFVNKVRAFNPEPMAWCIWRENPIQIVSANLVLAHSVTRDFEVGRITLDGNRVLVAVNTNQQVQLVTVKPAGKQEMEAIDWYRGFSDESDLWLK